MRALGRCLAALLVATVATPWVFGIGACCEHHAPTPRVVRHQCEHSEAEALPDTAGSCLTLSHRCCISTRTIPAREDRRLPKTTFSQTLINERVSLATISLQFSLPPYGEPPPQASSARRATLCSFLI